jgi:1-deoxy-D-xylulose-5-phosphate reductoisomerase
MASSSSRKRLLILGSTGSIGRQALDVCARCEEFELVGLSAERSWEELIEQARTHGVRRVALGDPHAAARAGEAWTDGKVLAGADGLVRLVVESGAELVLNALVGSAGLAPRWRRSARGSTWRSPTRSRWSWAASS